MRAIETKSITVLSLGAGVQSTCVLLMAERGLIERPVEAIFADTGWEPPAVYAHLEFLRSQTSIPISQVNRGNLRSDALASESSAWMPLYIANLDGGQGVLRRQCTKNYKIMPIRRRVREIMAEHGAKAVRQQIGISLDEAVQRMKSSGVKYITNVWPLVELRMDRAACVRWLLSNGYYEPAKSSCIGCPYHSREHWREMKLERPEEFEDACSFDEAIRLKRHFSGESFIHRAMIPPREVDFSNEVDRGQMSFLDECDGVCAI